ncbi:Protein of unknown function [Rhizobium sp. NFR07]|uniref:DUF3618 domain-containing protein n=1 Tax=Rhizobium sp. NFR07 TaxID=1566262 RepID=UPI0008F15BBD|nr:DUF3618 domain-containing protein [Rhizobium sp. NFR07]SFB60863.1 Protein of unknown function [Rhizobium sp. NFR07]
MAYMSDNPRSVEIEQEIAQDRQRIEERLDAIQQLMSPGQLVDEALAYVKSSCGGEYALILGAAVKNNPIPLALMGVGLAWLMAGPKNSVASYAQSSSETYPLATTSGNLRRIGPPEAEGDVHYSHFSDAAGSRFKALTDGTGRRAGHFNDASGKTYRGFADATGRPIHDIRDEAGNLFDEASGWISNSWQSITGSAGKAGQQLSNAAGSATDVGSQLNDAVLKHFKDQPLVGGALAFALGAAIGATLPHTQTEDEALGEASDRLKDTVSAEVSKTVDKAGEAASEAYHKAVTIASDVHDDARARIVAESAPTTRAGPNNSDNDI